MDANFVISAITSVGFPIVCCGAMGWYVKYITDKNREDIKVLNKTHTEEVKAMNEQHTAESQGFTEAINNNTIALTKLCEKLDE